MRETGPHFRDVLTWLRHGSHWDLIGLWLWLHSVEILSFVIAAYVAYWLQMRRAGDGERIGFLRFALPKETIVSRSAFADYLFVIVPRLLGRVSLVPALIGAFALSDLLRPYTVYVLGAYSPAQQTSPALDALFIAGWILATDFGIYISHWLRHRVKFLWEFHKVHHSADVLNPITVYREHPVDGFVQDITSCACAALFMTVFGRYVQLGLVQTTILGVNAVILSRLLTMQHLRHSQIALYFPEWLDRILISPVNHQLHHSSDEAHFDSNFGNVFSIWDHLFGTFRAAAAGETFHYGLPEDDQLALRHNFLRLLLVPFVNAMPVLKRIGRSAPAAAQSQAA